MKIARYFSNPYLVYKGAIGKINLYVALDRATYPYKHAYEEAENFIKSLQVPMNGIKKGIGAATYFKGMGLYEGADENMFQLVFVNGGRYAKEYKEFVKHFRRIARALAVKFGQKVVLIEEITPEGKYRMSEYVNYKAFPTLKEERQERMTVRSLVAKGIAKSIGRY